MSSEASVDPGALGPGGRRLWDATLADLELQPYELALLLQACRTVDNIDALGAIIAVEGVTADSSQGVRAHPALVEARQQRLALAKLLASLRIPEEGSQVRPQRRGGTRPASLSVAR